MDWFSILILAWVCVAIGYFGAGYVANYRNRKSGEPEASPEDAEQSADRTEVLRLWRENDAGQLLTEVDGEVMRSPEQLNPDQHARVSLAIADFNNWIGDGKAPVPGEDAVETVTTEPPVETPADRPQAQIEIEVASSAPEPETKPASMSFIKSLVHTAQAENKLPPEDQSIASQVDEILQAKLEGTEFEDQAIRLMDLPNQGMVIFVGLDKYPDIEQVPDPEIQKLLKESVSEWETRMLRAAKKREIE